MSKKRKITELFWTEKKTAEIKMFYFFIHTKRLQQPVFTSCCSRTVITTCNCIRLLKTISLTFTGFIIYSQNNFTYFMPFHCTSPDSLYFILIQYNTIQCQSQFYLNRIDFSKNPLYFALSIADFSLIILQSFIYYFRFYIRL